MAPWPELILLLTTPRDRVVHVSGLAFTVVSAWLFLELTLHDVLARPRLVADRASLANPAPAPSAQPRWSATAQHPAFSKGAVEYKIPSSSFQGFVASVHIDSPPRWTT